MSEPLILAIDGGSQSTKVALVRPDGTIAAEAQVPLRPSEFPQPGQVVHPDDDLWTTLVQACRRLPMDDVVAVGLCSIRFCRAFLDEQGRLLEPVLSWMDRRVDGAPHRDDYRWVTTASGYLTRRLVGAMRDTAANYRGWWPIDLDSWRWPDDLAIFERFGMPADRLADLVDPGEPLGEVTAEAAETTTIPVGTPVFATANDKAVEALGAGLVAPGGLLLSLGTYIAAMTVAAGRTPDGDPRIWSNFHSVPGRYLDESGGIRRGMWTVSWVRDLVGHDLQTLNREASQVPPGSDGVLTVLDFLAPGSEPWRRGSVLGLTGQVGRAQLYRSVLEGICFTMADHAEALLAALGSCADRLVVTGGGSRSDLMMQLAADVFERPAVRLRQPDAVITGAAICAAVGARWHPGFEPAAAELVHVAEVFEPSEAAEQYRAPRERHRRARGALSDFYRTSG